MPVDDYNPPHCIRDVFLTAEAYWHGAAILRQSLGQGPMEDLGDFRYVVIANHALALELYLKCLLLLDRRKPGKHHMLETHFKNLYRSTRVAVKKFYQELLRSDLQMQAEHARRRKPEVDPDTLEDIDEVLRVSSNAFEQSRYPYDPAFRTHAYFGGPVALAVRSVIVDRHPLWDRAFGNFQARQHILSTSQAR